MPLQAGRVICYFCFVGHAEKGREVLGHRETVAGGQDLAEVEEDQEEGAEEEEEGTATILVKIKYLNYRGFSFILGVTY